MGTIGEAANLFTALTGWINSRRIQTHQNRRILTQALCETLAAATTTRAYGARMSLRLSDDEFQRSFGKSRWELQDELRDLWRAAGERLMAVGDHDRQLEDLFHFLYERCFEKSLFWADPDNYQEGRVDISLDRLIRDATDIIHEVRSWD